ncbi:MAG: DUF4268 domain-containing protein [Eubacteriales bacterium]|nr:DUF4268 domain-containing protein [Eubacteriales bacterium]
MFLIDTQNKKAVSLEKKSFSELKLSERYDLQEWIADNPRILGENLLIIQKEFDGFSDTNERLDLLALDESGKLVIIENKLDDSGKDVVWQALKYASYCATLTKNEISEVYQRYLVHGNAQDKISEFYDGQDFESIRLNPVEGDQRIILVAANFRKEVTSTVLWLRNYHSIDITCVKVTPYKDGEKLYLDVEQIIPIQDIGDYQIRLTAKKQEETISSKEEATRHKTRYRFWEKALPVMRVKTGIYNNVSPTKDNWITGASGHSGVVFNPVIRMDGARAELYIDTGDEQRNISIYEKLKSKENDIVSSFPGELIWQDLPGKRACRICVQYHEYGLNNEEHWDEIIVWLADNVAALMKAFKPLLDVVVKSVE